MVYLLLKLVHMQLMTPLIIAYAMIFVKTNQIN